MKNGVGIDISIMGADELDRAFRKAGDRVIDILSDAVDKIAIVMVGKSRSYSPVMTGNLRRSIDKLPQKKTRRNVSQEVAANVRTNAEYAPYVEFGTRFMAARRFFYRAAVQTSKEAKPIIRDAMSQITKEMTK